MDYGEVLISNIKQLVPLSETDTSIILDYFIIQKLNKKEYLLQKDEVSNYMNFIACGSLRSFYIDEEGKEHILQLGIEGWWINDINSYLNQTPSKHYVQAVEETVVMRIHRDDLKKVYTLAPVSKRFIRLKLQRTFMALQERTLLSMDKTAEERYVEFRTKYRNLEQRFPQYMIASYLGVTPEFLSSVRKKLASL